MEPLFEPITAEEFHKAQAPRGSSKTLKTEPRMLTTWYELPTAFGFCTVPAHDEIQQMLLPEQKEYRQVYPTRHVFTMSEGLTICRDCFMAEADKESVT
jgi:hypothetical protein